MEVGPAAFFEVPYYGVQLDEGSAGGGGGDGGGGDDRSRRGGSDAPLLKLL